MTVTPLIVPRKVTAAKIMYYLFQPTVEDRASVSQPLWEGRAELQKAPVNKPR